MPVLVRVLVEETEAEGHLLGEPAVQPRRPLHEDGPSTGSQNPVGLPEDVDLIGLGDVVEEPPADDGIERAVVERERASPRTAARRRPPGLRPDVRLRVDMVAEGEFERPLRGQVVRDQLVVAVAHRRQREISRGRSTMAPSRTAQSVCDIYLLPLPISPVLLYAEQAQYHGVYAVDTRRQLMTYSANSNRAGYSTVSNANFYNSGEYK